MGRKRLQLSAILDKSKRHTTFTKRRKGLFKKAQSLTERCGGQIAAIAFSNAGNGFCFGHPSVEGVVNRYIDDQTKGEDHGVHNVGENSGASAIEEPLSNLENRIKEAMGNGRQAWAELVNGLGFAELEELEVTMMKLKSTVVALREGNVPGDIAGRGV